MRRKVEPGRYTEPHVGIRFGRIAVQHGDLAVGQTTPAQQAFIAAIADLEGIGGTQVEPIERFEFYRRAQVARLIVQTGEATAYGNGLLAKGVIAP